MKPKNKPAEPCTIELDEPCSNLSERTAEILVQSKILTLTQLSALSRDDLLQLPGIGRRALREIEKALAEWRASENPEADHSIGDEERPPKSWSRKRLWKIILRLAKEKRALEKGFGTLDQEREELEWQRSDLRRRERIAAGYRRQNKFLLEKINARGGLSLPEWSAHAKLAGKVDGEKE